VNRKQHFSYQQSAISGQTSAKGKAIIRRQTTGPRSKAHRARSKELRFIHRRDAEYAKGRIFAQSGDDNWAKGLPSSRKNVQQSFSRQDAKPAEKNIFLLSPNFASFATLRSPCGVLALVETIRLGRAVTPRGESSCSPFRNSKFNRQFQKSLARL